MSNSKIVFSSLMAAIVTFASAPAIALTDLAVGPEAFDPQGGHIQGIAYADGVLYVLPAAMRRDGRRLVRETTKMSKAPMSVSCEFDFFDFNAAMSVKVGVDPKELGAVALVATLKITGVHLP